MAPHDRCFSGRRSANDTCDSLRTEREQEPNLNYFILIVPHVKERAKQPAPAPTPKNPAPIPSHLSPIPSRQIAPHLTPHSLCAPLTNSTAPHSANYSRSHSANYSRSHSAPHSALHSAPFHSTPLHSTPLPSSHELWLHYHRTSYLTRALVALSLESATLGRRDGHGSCERQAAVPHHPYMCSRVHRPHQPVRAPFPY